MKKIILSLLIVLLSITQGYSYTNNHKNYLKALETARKEKKPLFVFFTAKWCVPCNKMKTETLYPLMDELRKIYIVYFLDVDKKEEQQIILMYRKLRPAWRYNDFIPTYYLGDKKGKYFKKKAEGYKSRREFVSWCNGP